MQYPVSVQNFYKAVMQAHVDHLMQGEDLDVDKAVAENPELLLDVGYLQLRKGMLTYIDLYEASKGKDTELMREYLLNMHAGIERYGHTLDKQFDYMIDPANKEQQVFLIGSDLVEYYEYTLANPL